MSLYEDIRLIALALEAMVITPGTVDAERVRISAMGYDPALIEAMADHIRHIRKRKAAHQSRKATKV